MTSEKKSVSESLKSGRKELREGILERSWEAMGRLIAELHVRSRWKKEEGEDGNVLLRNESGEEYVLVRIKDEGSERNRKESEEMRTFLGKFFSKEKNDSAEDYFQAIEGALSAFFTIRNGEGKICALINGQLAAREDENASDLVVWYVATDPDYQKKGFGNELYEGLYRHALEFAKNKSISINSIVGEADPDVEGYLNKLGRRRVYYEDAEENYVEIPYFAPPSEFDETSSPEHFMIRFLDDRKATSAAEIMRVIENIYKLYTKKEYFVRYEKEEKKKYFDKVSGELEKIRRVLSLAKDGRVYLLSREEREKKARELSESGRRIREIET